MAYFDGVFYSNVLKMDTHLGVILPQDVQRRKGLVRGMIEEPPKALILLHGLSDSHVMWFAKTSILRYAENYNIAVFMPEVGRSFYQNMRYGSDYFRFVAEELPEYAAEAFHVATDPGSLMVAGLSMGGYGALRCVLTYPERYLGAGAFSSPADIARRFSKEGIMRLDPRDAADMEKERAAFWGEDAEVPADADLAKIVASRTYPENFKLLISCGTEDILHEDHTRLTALLGEFSVPFRNLEMSGGHEWPLWDRSIQEFLAYVLD